MQLQQRIEPLDEGIPGLPALNIFRTIARNEPLARGFLSLGGHLLRGEGLPAREREIVILRTGWRAQSEYEFGQHTTIGLAAGLTDDEVRWLADAGEPRWSAADASLVRMVDELCADDVVSDATWAELAARWQQEQLLELLVLAGYYRLVSGLLTSAGVALEPGTPGWPDGADARLRAPRA
jgi:4-carboxymuconolactone decarboxylase